MPRRHADAGLEFSRLPALRSVGHGQQSHHIFVVNLYIGSSSRSSNKGVLPAYAWRTSCFRKLTPSSMANCSRWLTFTNFVAKSKPVKIHKQIPISRLSLASRPSLLVMDSKRRISALMPTTKQGQTLSCTLALAHDTHAAKLGRPNSHGRDRCHSKKSDDSVRHTKLPSLTHLQADCCVLLASFTGHHSFHGGLGRPLPCDHSSD